MKVERLIKKDCDAYLVTMLGEKKEVVLLSENRIVCKYPNVFHEDLPDIPPIKEVEFAIEIIPGTQPP